MLLPHEIEVIRRDFCDLIRGPDGQDVILHWVDQEGAVDEYGDAAAETDMTETVRAHVAQVANHNVSVRAVARERGIDVQTGDTVFLFLPDVDLSDRPGLWIEVEGLGEFTPEAKPALDAHAHSVLAPSGQKMVQEIYCRVRR